ncbi:AAA family ATPase [Streptomyces sp. NPDC088921]|uniref:AAA family ATPase n=1 Tax=unclassified Streptomyces TaxID=2593676 RepID=UPI003447A0F2
MNQEHSIQGYKMTSENTKEARMEQFGPLLRYSIKGLFGIYDHQFSLDVTEPTILTGANGTGKSTVLRTINWVSRGNWRSLARIDFKEITLDFHNSRILILKTDTESLTLRILSPSETGDPWTYSVRSDPSFSTGTSDIRRRIAWLREELGTVWENLSANERETMILEYFEQEETSERPDWVSHIHNLFPALFVSDQRLAPETRSRARKRGAGQTTDVVTAIEAAVLEINEEVQRFKSLYGTASQNLDRNFPRRVFDAISSQREFGSREKVLRDFKEVQLLRASLADAGLIGDTEIEESIADLPLNNPDSLALISTYLSDTKEKLETFEPLRRRLEPFVDFLRKHYKGKTIEIDDKHGFTIHSTRTREPIRPDHLSSGEQQMFILAHKLLFEATPGTLVMIDEPELSLHVLWQSTFVDDLTEISEASGTYFLLATHSPTLIAGRTDLRRSLDA